MTTYDSARKRCEVSVARVGSSCGFWKPQLSSRLIDAAEDRLAYVTAFAISSFSNSRAKERAIRKPFNPLLGETFELLRSDAEVPGGGYRLLVEKVCHRPVRLAMQADSSNGSWSFAQSPAPSPKTRSCSAWFA